MSTPHASGAKLTATRLEVARPDCTAEPPRQRFRAKLHETITSAAPLWHALQSDGICTAYQRLDWVDGIVIRLMPARKARPLLVEITDGISGAPVMLLPLALIRRRGHAVITWLDLGVCDYAAPLLAPGLALMSRDTASLWAAVRAVLPRADLIQIDRIPETIGATANPLMAIPGIRPMPMRAHGIAIDGPAETLLKRLCSSSANQKFRKAERRLAREGEVRFVTAETEDQIEALFAALLDQRRQRFRDLGRADLLERSEVCDFYRAAAHEGLDNGPARMFGLSVGDVWIATALGLVHQGTFHGILLAMDSGWHHFSPGLRIVTEIMKWSRRQDLAYFDFTIGDLPYKAELGAVPRPLHQFAVAQSLRGTAVFAGSQLLATGKAHLQAHPRAFDVLRNGRQAMRRWLGQMQT